MNDYMNLLGHKATDRVTGFSGVVTSISFDLYGCVQVVVTPEAEGGAKLGESHWFDAKRVNVTSTSPVMQPMDFGNLPAGAERGPERKPPMSSRAV